MARKNSARMGAPLALVLLGLAGLSYFPEGTTRLLAWVGLVAGLALLGRAWRRGRKKPSRRPRPDERSPAPRARQAAAVCFRRRGERLEFLLVRSSAGTRRLLPKGNIEKGETLWGAAAREAREEAGVKGQIERTPLTLFWHRPNGKSGEWAIAAFLLEVTRLTDKGEDKRSPKWYSPEKADEALQKNRSAKEAAELRRVLRLAAQRLQAR